MNEYPILSGELLLQAASIAPENPKAVVVLVHGMAEHKERYYPFMTYLSQQGYACVIYDQRGHGATAQNSDDLGYFGKKGMKTLIEDTANVVRHAKEQFPGLKVILLGHSMGSMVVRCYCKKYDAEINGLLVCGSPSKNPVAGLGIFVTRVMQLFKGDRYRSKDVAMMMFGKHEKKFKAEGMRNSWLSENRANVQEYNEDPLCGFRFTLNGYRVVMQLLKNTYSAKGWEVNNPDLPVHFIAGSNDPCINSINQFAKAVSFFRDRGYRRVSSKLYPGMRHEVLNEIGKEEVWKDVETVFNSWL